MSAISQFPPNRGTKSATFGAWCHGNGAKAQMLSGRVAMQPNAGQEKNTSCVRHVVRSGQHKLIEAEIPHNASVSMEALLRFKLISSSSSSFAQSLL